MRPHSTALPARKLLPLLVIFCTIAGLTRAIAQPAPSITQPPQSLTVIQGSNASFTVAATGQVVEINNTTFARLLTDRPGRLASAKKKSLADNPDGTKP